MVTLEPNNTQNNTQRQEFGSALLHRTLSGRRRRWEELKRNTIKCTLEFQRIIPHSVCLEATNCESFWQKDSCWWIFQYFTTGIVKLPTNHPLLSCAVATTAERGRTCAKLGRVTRKAVCELWQEEKSWWRICVWGEPKRRDELERKVRRQRRERLYPLEEEAVHLMSQQACVIDRSKTNVSLAAAQVQK